MPNSIVARFVFRALVSSVLAAVAITWSDRASGQSPRRPNILFILADDVGMDLVSCYGADLYRTPNIDSLARSGIRFQTCYATPLCGPSRCEALTGRYPFRTGGLTNQSWLGGRGPSPQTEISIAALLKQSGYATGHAGKWRQLGQTPRDWGFDEYLTDSADVGYYWKNSYIVNGQLVHLGQQTYIPDVTEQFAADFFQRHRNEPFFFYFAPHLVHIPIERTPDSRPGATRDQLYADNIAYVDKQVGQLTTALAALGLSGNTLVVFSGDNGSAGKPGTIGGRPLHGSKGTMTEGGSRVPLIANWPGVTPAATVNNGLVDFSDLYPTFAAVAGAQLPAGVTIDGQSFAGALRGGGGTARSWAFVQLANQWFVRDAAWKLNNRGELFDMTDAPFTERPILPGDNDPAAFAARLRLGAILADLNPAAGRIQ
jgi:arylsulfatase A-like enzyme